MTVKASGPAYLLAMGTAPSADVARRIVTALLERRLIACGTVVPGAVSTYRWQGKVETAEEVVLLMKTGVERAKDLAQAYPTLHPYDVPELILVPITGGHQPYLDWLSAETT